MPCRYFYAELYAGVAVDADVTMPLRAHTAERRFFAMRCYAAVYVYVLTCC